MFRKHKAILVLLILAVIGAIFYSCTIGKGCSVLGIGGSSTPDTNFVVSIGKAHIYYANGVSQTDAGVTLLGCYVQINGKWKLQASPIMLIINPGDIISVKRLK